MRIFFIPSWYPSPNSPLTGIFFQDQAQAITTLYPAHEVAVSTWGQNDDRLLLWAKKPLKSLYKYFQKPPARLFKHADNFWEFFNPTFTWTRWLKGGNLKAIIEANEKTLEAYIQQKGEVAIIHAHVGFPAGYIASVLSKKYHIPYVITEQMSPFPFPYFLKGGKLMPMLAEAYQGAKTNIAISHSLLEQMAVQGVARLCYIPNLIDETFFLPAQARHEVFTFFMLGRMVAQKGVDILLNAISLLVKDFPHIHFRLGGDGSEKEAYEQLAQKLQVAPYITWLGELGRQEALREFQNCHAFVLPSIHETMGVVLAEALACGKPLVSTYCGGAESVVTPQNGFLARVGDAADLAEKLANMIKNYAQYAPEVLRQDALNRFSRKVIVDTLLETYEKAISF